jgi:flagellar basal body-associated protein FliL
MKMRSVRLIAAAALALALGVAARAADDGDKDSKKPKHKVTQSDSYIEIDPMYASILDGDRPVGMLMIGVGLDVPDAKLRDEAVHAMPVLRDAFVRNLMSFSTTAVRPERQPDVALIASRLQAVADRALGRKGARVLLAQVALRITK